MLTVLTENEENIKKEYLGKKREKKSNEKTVSLARITEEGEEIVESERKFKSENDFYQYLSSLKNPFAIKGGNIIDLSSEFGKSVFYDDLELDKIYEKEDDFDLLEDYKLLYGIYISSNEKIVEVNYPMAIKTFVICPKFFLELPETNLPKLYDWIRNIHNGVNVFFKSLDYRVFHLFARKKCGTTFYLMKQMSRNPEYKIYIDLRKLKEILNLKQNKKRELQKFIFYSLFYIHNFYGNDILIGYSKIKNYYNQIWMRVIQALANKNENIINSLLDAYVYIYKTYFIKIFNIEELPMSKSMSIIIDHYEGNFELSKINQMIKCNEQIKILIIHSTFNKKNIENLFNYIDNDEYKLLNFYSKEGIELVKNDILIGYYNEMIDFGKKNFEELELLKIYKDILIENFGLNNPNYYIKFLQFCLDNNVKIEKQDLNINQSNEKNVKSINNNIVTQNQINDNSPTKKDSNNQNNYESSIIKQFIKIITKEIEYNINKFYEYDLSDENYYLSKYYNEFETPFNEHDQNTIYNIKKNIPLDYFTVKYEKNTKNIIDIKPSFNLINKIITKKSKIFDCIIYQSQYYDKTNNMGEKGNILQRAIEEKIQIEPSILLNYFEKTLIFKLEYIIPYSKNINKKTIDEVENYYKEQIITRTRNSTKKKEEKYDKKDITKYMSKDEIKEMEELSKKLSSEKEPYNNVIIIENNSRAKNYDLAIIKFIDGNSFVLILVQITVSRDNSKFGGINQRFQKDLNYFIAKLEFFLPGFHSKSVHLIYILDKRNDNIIPELNTLSTKERATNKIEKSEDENINYKYQIPKELSDNVHLIFFSRKFLNFFNNEGKMIKELVINKDNNIKFETSDLKHYFSIEYIQKVFNKVLESFNIKVGKYYIDSYDYNDMNGNYLIITKLNINHLNIIININGKKVHILKAIDSIISNVENDTNYEERISYFFEIINPKEVNKVSVFDKIIID